MRIEPITPAQKPGDRHPNRATMSVRGTRHTVNDNETGKKHDLPMKEAWALHQHLNDEGYTDIVV